MTTSFTLYNIASQIPVADGGEAAPRRLVPPSVRLAAPAYHGCTREVVHGGRSSRRRRAECEDLAHVIHLAVLEKVRADRSLDVCDDSRTGETAALEEHSKGRADSGKSITPSGALIHIVSCLENRYGHSSEGASVSALLSKLGAYVAGDLKLRPRDLDAACLAAAARGHHGCAPR